MAARAIVVAGLGFGDEGKGSVVDYLVRREEATLVVRYNGGPQAGHRVVEPDGREHVFSQFGSGTFVPGVRTHLSRYALVNPLNLERENEHLVEVGVDDALDRLSIDASCTIITPFHVAANRIRELARGPLRHGSCGQGVGEARGDAIGSGLVLQAGVAFLPNAARPILRDLQLLKLRRANDAMRETTDPETRERIADEMVVLLDPDAVDLTIDAYRWLAPFVRQHRWLRDVLTATSSVVVFEGAQGVLLDERWGLIPHNTWTDTTFRNAIRLLEEADVPDQVVSYVGVTRAYTTRHGAGPFPTESVSMTASLRDDENGDDPWQGSFRVGHLDVPFLRHALRHARPDEIALTCLDRIADRTSCLYGAELEGKGDLWDSPRIYRPIEPTAYAYGELFAKEGFPPITIVSEGPTADDKSYAPAEVEA